MLQRDYSRLASEFAQQDGITSIAYNPIDMISKAVAAGDNVAALPHLGGRPRNICVGILDSLVEKLRLNH